MRTSLVFLALGGAPLLVGGMLHAEVEIRTPPPSTVAVIPGRIADGTPSPPPPPVEIPAFRIESTQVKRVDVVEPPPLAGLPPVEGTITLKVHSVADPGLPDPPPPPPPPPIEDPQTLAGLADPGAHDPGTRLVFISATVYDRNRTMLRCYPHADGDKVIDAWSNLDFNHFGGITGIDASGGDGEVRSYVLLLGIGNEDTNKRRALLAARGIEYEAPDIPTLPDDQPAFVIETENPDPQGVTLLEDLHALYRSEGSRMAEAAATREAAHAARKAFLLANPPQPKDVTVHFWKRTKGDEDTREEGGRP